MEEIVIEKIEVEGKYLEVDRLLHEGCNEMFVESHELHLMCEQTCRFEFTKWLIRKKVQERPLPKFGIRLAPARISFRSLNAAVRPFGVSP